MLILHYVALHFCDSIVRGYDPSQRATIHNSVRTTRLGPDWGPRAGENAERVVMVTSSSPVHIGSQRNGMVAHKYNCIMAGLYREAGPDKGVIGGLYTAPTGGMFRVIS